MKQEIEKLPTLTELMGIDKYNLTYSQRCDCITLANHNGLDAAVKQAVIFEINNQNQISKPLPSGG